MMDVAQLEFARIKYDNVGECMNAVDAFSVDLENSLFFLRAITMPTKRNFLKHTIFN